MKPGFKTTEFWLSLAVLVAASVMLGIDKIDSDLWVIAITGVTGGYALSRGAAKVTQPTETQVIETEDAGDH